MKKESIGLKNLEKIFNIHREGDVISGLKLAKIIKNINGYEEYLENVSEDKIENLLLYNEQDVINLFNILINWNKYIM